MYDQIRSFFTMPPKRPSSPLGAGQSAEDEPAIPAFQQAWKDGATFDDLFGPDPFTLHGSVGRSGADNHRPDVAKVETFLGDAGYYKPLTADGPSGWHSTNLDTAIRSFQKDNGLAVDGFLKPGGPTIAKIGSRLGEATPAQAHSTVWSPPRPPATEGWPPIPIAGSDRPEDGGITGTLPRPERPANPEPAPPMTTIPTQLPQPPGDIWEILAGRKPKPQDPFFGHTISEDGAREHDAYAANLVRDSNPDETARYLKNVITWSGDQGRGDVADLLGRFANMDEAKAKALQGALHRASGERIPFRIAPLGEGMASEAAGEQEADPPKRNPWGDPADADRWEAGNMAKALLGKSDYADAVTHFAGEFKRDPATARAYTAAVYEDMAATNPKQAVQFAQAMGKAGLAEEVTKPEGQPAPVQGTDAGSGTTTEATPAPQPNPPVAAPAPPPAPTEAPQTTPPPEPPTTTPAPAPSKPDGSGSGEAIKPANRPPVDGHMATKSIDEIQKEAEANGGHLNTQQDRDRGNGEECTALVKHVTGLGQTSDWRAGEKIKGADDPPLKPGTAIATFNDKGTYGTEKGRHAAIFLGYKTDDKGQKGMEVLEQSKDRPVQRKFIPFSSDGKFIYQAGNYSVVKK